MRKVVIVGGGSAGWMAAAYLNAVLNQRGKEHNVEITLLESPDIPRISVGEATIPSMRHLLSVIGVDEIEFMRVTDATFKQSIKYVNWTKNDNSFYHHPFSRYHHSNLDVSARDWLNSDRSIPYMETVSAQPIICEMGRSPLMLQNQDNGLHLNYAFHMNAQKFADYLRDFSVARGVIHIRANLKEVCFRDNGFINAVKTDANEVLTGDLFIDCTGFKAKLIDEAMHVGTEDLSQWLLCDSAVTMHVPYETHYPGMVRPYTTATAISNGWVWDIPMQSQRSIGYVHSSHFISGDEAEKEMRAYQGAGIDQLNSRHIKFKVQRRLKHWEKNCIAIGLSGGFIEPLESTGLYLSDLGAVALAEHFPHSDEHMEALAFRYNRVMTNRYYEILDFINMHYCMTQRTDTAFWREVQKPERINDRLKAKLEYWSMKVPSALDFEDQCFLGSASSAGRVQAVDTAALWNHDSYLCILLGMNRLESARQQYISDVRLPPTVYSKVLERIQLAHKTLPPHALWLNKSVGMKNYSAARQPDGWVS
tara:strand:- start:6696 stop:8300 length:1605 start_codon:yes stop_codon:yes gene_type:complete